MKKGYLYIFLSAILFSTMEITLKVISSDYNPIQLTILRFIIGAIVLFPFALSGLKKKNCRLGKDDILFFALTGFICVVVSMVLFQLAVMYAEASAVAVLFSCNPVFVIPFAFFILHEKIYRRTILSLVFSLAGMLFIINPFHVSGEAAGFAFAILSAVTFALYGVTGRKRSERYGSFALTCFSFIFGASELFLLILMTRIDKVASFLTGVGLPAFADIPVLQGIGLAQIPGLLYVGICITGFGYLFYFLAMEATSAATASLIFFIKPALAPVLAFLILAEPLTFPKVTGILLILVGSLCSLFPELLKRKGNAPV